MAARRSSTRIALRRSRETKPDSDLASDCITTPGDDDDVAPPSLTPPLPSDDDDDDDQGIVKTPKLKRVTATGRVTKPTWNSPKRRGRARNEDDDDFVPDKFQQLSSEYRETRVTRRRSLNDGYQIEERTTESTQRVTTVTKLDQNSRVPAKFIPAELKVTLSVPTLGELLIKLAKNRRKEIVYDNRQYRIKFNWTPYYYHDQPTAKAAHQVYAILKEWLFNLDGTVVEIDMVDADARDGPAHGAKGISVDALVRVIMSQATSNENALTTQETLIQKFTYTVDGKEVVGKVPNYHKMRLCPRPQLLQYVLRAGLAERRSEYILTALQAVFDENYQRLESTDGVEMGNPPDTVEFVPGLLSLDFLMEKSKVDLFNWFCYLRGVGAKSSACLLEFNYGFQVCAVDTHVYNIATYLGWIPDECKDPNQAFNHLDARLPPHLKHAIHQQFWHHGQKCGPCKKQRGEEVSEGDTEICPIEAFIVKRLKARKQSSPKKKQETADAIKKEPELGDTVAKGRYKSKELAASKGWMAEKYEINDDFDAGSPNKVAKERWKYVGVEAATLSIKQTLITTLFLKKSASTVPKGGKGEQDIPKKTES